MPRTKIKLSHNKFVVHLKGGSPTRVWTGWTNFTEAGFCLQTNAGLLIENAETAAAYEAYWKALNDDPLSGRKLTGSIFAQDLVSKIIADSRAALHGKPWDLYYSPVRSDHVVDAARELIRRAQSVILMSAPFAMDGRIIEALGDNDERIIEYGSANTTAKKKIERLNSKSTRFFTSTRLETYMGCRWDAKAFGKHKIHAKLMVVDPWGESRAALMGSVNFSRASCPYNDENALLATGDHRMAATLATEFLRMFDHYRSRAFINKFFLNTINEERYLEHEGSWSRIYFNQHSRSYKFREREVFAGRL